ncbi:MAG: VOC family protein [Hellea sp.]
MKPASLEHVNITVKDPKKTAAILCKIFDWHVRWEGASMDNGYTVHVGSEESYIALYSTGTPKPSQTPSYKTIAALNHIALTVDDLESAEKRVLAAGFETENHGDYEPGRRFYFRDDDNVEYEIVSYSKTQDLGR